MSNGILPLALFCRAVRAGEPVIAFAGTDFGVFAPWTRPLVDAGGPGAIPESPRDLLYEARTCQHALAAVRAGDAGSAERLYAALLPAEGELAGAGSGLLALDPVARYLGDLATVLHRPHDAAAHHRRAEELTETVRRATAAPARTGAQR